MTDNFNIKDLKFALNGTNKSYRKVISELREYNKVTERLLSLHREDEIENLTKTQKKRYRNCEKVKNLVFSSDEKIQRLVEVD